MWTFKTVFADGAKQAEGSQFLVETPQSPSKIALSWHRQTCWPIPHNYSYLILGKGARNKHWGKYSHLRGGCWENGYSQNWNQNPLTCTKINSKWIKDLNIRCETLKILQEEMRKNFKIWLSVMTYRDSDSSGNNNKNWQLTSHKNWKASGQKKNK